MTWENAPKGLGWQQRRRFYADQLKRREIETAQMSEVMLAAGLTDILAPAAVTVAGAAPKRGRLRRAASWLWNQRIAMFAVVLSLVIELTIVATQVPYYAQLPGMAPTLAGFMFRVYWMMPIITGALTLYYGAAAAFVVDKKSGRYSRYLRLMWFFASIGALVNINHSLRLMGDQDWITAVVLGGGSLASPLVLHSWTGLRIAIDSGFSLQDLVVTGRRWVRHPQLSIQFAYRLDLFPELDASEVWEMTVRQTRERVLTKVNKVAAESRPGKRSERKVHKEVHSPDPVNSAVNSEGSQAVPAETEAETTAERDLKLTTLVAAYYLMNDGVHPKRTQKFISEAALVSEGYTSTVFRACKAGKYPRPDDGLIADVAAHFAKVAVTSPQNQQ